MSLASYRTAPPRGTTLSERQLAGAAAIGQGCLGARCVAAPCPLPLTVREPCDSPGTRPEADLPAGESREALELLKRRAKQVPDLSTYLAKRSKQTEPVQPAGG